jgi:hypothetical protein
MEGIYKRGNWKENEWEREGDIMEGREKEKIENETGKKMKNIVKVERK